MKILYSQATTDRQSSSPKLQFGGPDCNPSHHPKSFEFTRWKTWKKCQAYVAKHRIDIDIDMCPWRQSHSFLHCSQHETHHLWTEHLTAMIRFCILPVLWFEKGVWMLKLFKGVCLCFFWGSFKKLLAGLSHEIHTARTVTSWSCCTECTGRCFLQSPVVPCAAFQKVESSKPSTPSDKVKRKTRGQPCNKEPLQITNYFPTSSHFMFSFLLKLSGVRRQPSP